MAQPLIAPPNVAERALYHQVRPLKLATDFSTAAASLLLLGRHQLATALVVMWVPSVLVSTWLIRFGNFSKTRDSALGAYLRRYMTRSMEALRFAGMGLAAVGAWEHAPWLIVVGALVIASGWFGPWLLARARR